MRKYMILSIFTAAALMGSNNLTEEIKDYHPRDYKKGPILHVKLMNNIDNSYYEELQEHAIKHALTYNFEIAKKNDTEYFFKQYLTPMMEKLLSNISKFDIDQRFEISTLKDKFHNFKQFSEKYYDFQESLVALNTNIFTLDVLTSIMSLYKNSQEKISAEISKYYEMLKDKSVPEPEPESSSPSPSTSTDN